MLGYLSTDVIFSEKRTVFRDFLCERIFAPNGGYCVYYPLNIFFKTCAVLKIKEYHSDTLQFQSEHIQSHELFKPIARERK